MGGKAIVVLFIGILVVSGLIFLSIARSSNAIARNSDKAFLKQTAENYAQS